MPSWQYSLFSVMAPALQEKRQSKHHCAGATVRKFLTCAGECATSCRCGACDDACIHLFPADALENFASLTSSSASDRVLSLSWQAYLEAEVVPAHHPASDRPWRAARWLCTFCRILSSSASLAARSIKAR